MTRALRLFVLGTLLVWATPSLAVQTQKVAPPQNEVRQNGKVIPVARVRIPMALTVYNGIPVRAQTGGLRMEYRPGTIVKHTMRARMERINHFYVGQWHIETVPVAWQRETKRYTVKIRFYKRHGQGEELEESIGTTQVAGVLADGPEKLVFNFSGKSLAKFKDTKGNPLLDVAIGPFDAPTAKAPVVSKNQFAPRKK